MIIGPKPQTPAIASNYPVCKEVMTSRQYSKCPPYVDGYEPINIRSSLLQVLQIFFRESLNKLEIDNHMVCIYTWLLVFWKIIINIFFCYIRSSSSSSSPLALFPVEGVIEHRSAWCPSKLLSAIWIRYKFEVCYVIICTKRNNIHIL